VDEGRRTENDDRSARTIVVRCAWCGRVKVDSEWQDEDDVQAMGLLTPSRRFSDGICPSCLARYTDRTA
jgi:hypothetical protein